MTTAQPSTPAPFYVAVGDEVTVFEAAFEHRTPVLLKGPTGCGKTRFLEHMAARLGTERLGRPWPLTVVTCHEDMSGSDLVGHYVLTGGETLWRDGPVTAAARAGALCYLDEVVEARKDTTVLIHSLTDHRRYLPIDKLGEVVEAHDDFMMAVSYNPGYQSTLKDLKRSTRQRFLAIEFSYPDVATEALIIETEAGTDDDTAEKLATVGEKLRNLEGATFDAPSTRLLIYAGRLLAGGLAPDLACRSAIIDTATDDPIAAEAAAEVIRSIFGTAPSA